MFLPKECQQRQPLAINLDQVPLSAVYSRDSGGLHIRCTSISIQIPAELNIADQRGAVTKVNQFPLAISVSQIRIDLNVVGQGTLISIQELVISCLLYTSPSPRDATLSRMPSSA